MRSAIVSEFGKIRYFCSSWKEEPNLAVHELRKSFKRLRSVFRFYRKLPGVSVDPLIRDIKRFGRLLSPLRESYINAGLVAGEEMELTIVPESRVADVAAALQRKNSGYITGDSRMFGICRQIEAFYAANEVKPPEVPEEDSFSRLVVSEIKSSYSRGYESYLALADDYPAEELHSLRKKLKRLYYQLDFVKRFTSSIFAEMTEELDTVNDLLGDDHDLHVLEAELRSPEYDLPGEDFRAVGRRVFELRKEILLALLPRLKGFFSMTPGELEGVLAGEFMN